MLGGGHANVQVLKKLCMHHYEGLHTILINNSGRAIYSGMTPGYIQGEFDLNEIAIDLQRLCYNADSTFIDDYAIGIDEHSQRIDLKDHPPIFYDVLSINTGSLSRNTNIKIHKKANCFPVKPISELVYKIKLIDELVETLSSPIINLVGGGVAAYELCFALRQRYTRKILFNIISDAHLSEKNLNSKTINKMRNISKEMKINEIKGSVSHILPNEIKLSNGKSIKSNLCLLSTGAELPQWLLNSKLEKINGYLAVNEKLQCLNHENIFATGDVASLKRYDRPKSGVMAVRQGEILRENLFYKLQNKTLKKYKPQTNWLYIIGSYPKKGLLNFYHLSFHHHWCWVLKKWIDQRFMKKFVFPNKTRMDKKKHFFDDEDREKMFCQGCGSKVSKNSLLQILNQNNENPTLGDSTLIKFPKLRILQTIDFIKLFSSFDPFDFGIISYFHSQNDIIASGGKVHSYNISIGIPFSEAKAELFYLENYLRGIQEASRTDQSKLTSGHSYQTIEPGVAIQMNGTTENGIGKNQAKKNDLIYLSKPLGTGYLLFAYYKNSSLLTSYDFQRLLSNLKMNNLGSVKAANLVQSRCMTDISGFGLASHLGDICQSSNLSAKISLTKNILINSNEAILRKYQSTGYRNNFEAMSSYVDIKNKHIYENILYDPQTNGPILMVINSNKKNYFEKAYFDLNQSKPILIGSFIKYEKKLIHVNDFYDT